MIANLFKDSEGNMTVLISQCQHINGEVIEIPVDVDLGLPEISPQSTQATNNNVSPPEPLICFIAKDYDDDLS